MKSLLTRLFIGVVVFIGAAATNAVALERELSAAASALADEIASSAKTSVAVVDFIDLQGCVTELGRYVAEELALGLVVAKKGLKVVDRAHLRALLQEHKLAATGIVDPATARKLGEIAGVGALVTGTITPLGDSVRVVVKVLDTSTADTLTASGLDVAKTKTIEELLARDIGNCADATPRDPPVARTGIEARTGTQPSVATVFQNGSTRVTVIGASRSGHSVRLSLAVENILREPLLLAIHPDSSNEPMLTLNDDQGGTWNTSAKDVSGVKVLVDCRLPGSGCRLYGGGTITITEQDFTTIEPAERSMLVMNFRDAAVTGWGDRGAIRRGGSGGTFTFNAQMIRYARSGNSNFSIALAGIKIP